MQGKTRKSEQYKHRQLNFDNSNVTHKTEETSLGIIQNISACNFIIYKIIIVYLLI